jgi:hypothetical protein
MKNERVLVSEVKEASKEVTKLAPPSSQQSTSLPFKGIRRGVERYSDAHHHSTNGHLLPEAERTAREWTCGLCYGPVSYGYLEHNGSICHGCGTWAHWDCLGVPPEEGETMCLTCSTAKTAKKHSKAKSILKASEKQASKRKYAVTEEDEPDEESEDPDAEWDNVAASDDEDSYSSAW